MEWTFATKVSRSPSGYSEQSSQDGSSVLSHSSVVMSVHVGLGQVGGIVHELAPEHSVSQLQESVQSMPAVQVAVDVQFTRHGPAPQLMSESQESLPTQMTRQSLAAVQLTPPPHEFLPVHSTRHLTPGGQTTSVAHASLIGHSITQVSPSQREQVSGHRKLESGAFGSASGALGSASGSETPPSPDSTHQPPAQTRPPLQSAWLSHE